MASGIDRHQGQGKAFTRFAQLGDCSNGGKYLLQALWVEFSAERGNS